MPPKMVPGKADSRRESPSLQSLHRDAPVPNFIFKALLSAVKREKSDLDTQPSDLGGKECQRSLGATGTETVEEVNDLH
jgi:hypothetical protein